MSRLPASTFAPDAALLSASEISDFNCAALILSEYPLPPGPFIALLTEAVRDSALIDKAIELN